MTYFVSFSNIIRAYRSLNDRLFLFFYVFLNFSNFPKQQILWKFQLIMKAKLLTIFSKFRKLNKFIIFGIQFIKKLVQLLVKVFLCCQKSGSQNYKIIEIIVKEYTFQFALKFLKKMCKLFHDFQIIIDWQYWQKTIIARIRAMCLLVFSWEKFVVEVQIFKCIISDKINFSLSSQCHKKNKFINQVQLFESLKKFQVLREFCGEML